MRSFRTEFTIDPCPEKVGHSGSLLTIGSCFSEAIGEKLLQSKFDVLANPFGVIYNPISILELLECSLRETPLAEEHYLQSHARFYHFQAHSRLSGTSREDLQVLLEKAQQDTLRHLQASSHLFITFGTAFVFRHVPSNALVANCHKVPQKQFKKELLTLEQMRVAFDRFYKILRQVCPKVQLVFTVSPVRHIRDGISANQVSKSLLRLLCEQLARDYSNVFYFPAYEIMMDDLRDYRFYKDDLIHPNSMAEAYIWEKFQDCFFDRSTQNLVKEIEQIQRSLSHRPFEPLSQQHGVFLRKLAHQIQQLPQRLDFSSELAAITDQLNQIEY
ncbi:GSCFA domain-containing protein [Cyclobacterium xiamenense]|uniref:GSCFA domain-containing protein n=1 Tax=Cyclobacterium xiamenense TaxID=1297121 RepID=UPI0012B9482A|nr:GSCFA domain-containing protein [Cyclobacterium xiamenense]